MLGNSFCHPRASGERFVDNFTIIIIWKCPNLIFFHGVSVTDKDIIVAQTISHPLQAWQLDPWGGGGGGGGGGHLSRCPDYPFWLCAK